MGNRIGACVKRTIRAIDLFAGAGGTSTGLLRACEDRGIRLDLLAVNHWDVAISTHSKNHPNAQHLCENLDNVSPGKVFSGHLDLLVASPECIHFSTARGGRPTSDQLRASGWHVIRWAEALRPDNILIENVKEYRDWGAIGSNGQPLKSRKGETYQAFLGALRSLGYTVEDNVLNAANYGDATSRERLFIMARRGRRKINWPKPGFAPVETKTGNGTLQKWHTAREIIDWDLKSQSLFERKRPLAENTIQRLIAGLRKFGGEHLIEPFLVMMYGTGQAASLDLPLPTITAQGNHIGLAQPFLMSMVPPRQVAVGPRPPLQVLSIDEPMPAITSADGFALAQPYVKPSITAGDSWNLIQPFLLEYYGNGQADSVDLPIPTITSRDHFGLVETGRINQKLDIRFRMLQPHELAAAMSFPKDYIFDGTREQRVKQIGNAVAGNIAKALCGAILD